MEKAEYTTLFEQEEHYWWYQGLHRLVLEQLPAPLSGEAAAGGDSHHAGEVGAEVPGGDQAGMHAPPRVLDAGCGTGGMLRHLAARSRAVGLDLSPDALRLARRRGPLLLCRGSVDRLPFREGAFDMIISLDVLYHQAVRDDLEALTELRRCLRPGGTAVINLPAFESLRSTHDRAIHTARRYRRRPLHRLLQHAGFEVERLTYWNCLLLPAVAFIRLLRRVSARTTTVAPSDVRPVPRWVNAALLLLLTVERLWLRRANLPFGLSLLAVVRRPGEGR